MSAIRRVRWNWVLGGLVAAHAVLLAHAVRRYQEDRTLARLVAQGTPESYARAIERAEPLRHRLLFNLGNLYLDRAQRLREAAPARAALAYYREALRLDPEFLEAKKNYELAGRLLESFVPPRPPREPRPPDRIAPSQMPLTPNQI